MHKKSFSSHTFTIASVSPCSFVFLLACLFVFWVSLSSIIFIIFGTKLHFAISGRRNSDSVRAKWFCLAFKLGFAQVMSKSSLLFQTNLELDLSTTLKQREWYESKYF